MVTKNDLAKGTEELHPVLSSMTLSFWRMRLVVERKFGTTPLKLLILQTASKVQGVNPGEICQRFGLDFSRITRLIQSLEKEGLLHRKRNSEDRRFIHLYLTEKGWEYLRERTQLINEELQNALGELSPDEAEELDRMLRIMAERVRM